MFRERIDIKCYCWEHIDFLPIPLEDMKKKCYEKSTYLIDKVIDEIELDRVRRKK